MNRPAINAKSWPPSASPAVASGLSSAQQPRMSPPNRSVTNRAQPVQCRVGCSPPGNLRASFANRSSVARSGASVDLTFDRHITGTPFFCDAGLIRIHARNPCQLSLHSAVCVLDAGYANVRSFSSQKTPLLTNLSKGTVQAAVAGVNLRNFPCPARRAGHSSRDKLL